MLSPEPGGSGVGPRVRLLLGDMLDQWRGLDRRIAALDDEFAAMARNDPAARRLATIPGVGVLNATALVAAIGDGRKSLVEPHVFQAPTVEDTVDHQGQSFNVRLQTGPVAAVEDDRSSIVIRQLSFDPPNQQLALLLV